jgi:hypothetical protein
VDAHLVRGRNRYGVVERVYVAHSMGDVNSIGTARTIRVWPPTKLHLLNSKQLLNNEALDVDYELIDDEERYRSAGPTDR